MFQQISPTLDIGLSILCIQMKNSNPSGEVMNPGLRCTCQMSPSTTTASWVSWMLKVAAMVFPDVTPGLCHLIGQHVTIVIMACHAKTATSPLHCTGSKQIVGGPSLSLKLRSISIQRTNERIPNSHVQTLCFP